MERHDHIYSAAIAAKSICILKVLKQIGPSVVSVQSDVVATKLGIIFIFISSCHLLFSRKGFSYDFEFLHAFLSNKKNKNS